MCVCVCRYAGDPCFAVGGFVERKRKQQSTLCGKEKDVLCSGANSVQQEGEREGYVCEVSVRGRVSVR